jgi:CBS domain containing-hemolysin-like protein
MNTFFQTAFEVLIILGLVAANGFFVATEFALVKVRLSQLQPDVKAGGWRVKLALKATQNLDAALSASQLGVTLASLGLGWVGEPFVARHIAPWLARVGIVAPSAVASISFVLAFIVITFLHLVLGEQAPKMYAIQRPKAVSLQTAGPLMTFYYLFYPFIWLLNATTNRLLKSFGMESGAASDHALSAEELEFVFTRARHTHPGDALINKLMVRSLRLRETTAQQIMRPREQVVALWLDKPLAENLRIAQTSANSRYPVCAGSLDDVRGIVLIREWLWQIQALGSETSFEPLIRPVLTFTLRTPVYAMIELFRSSRSHLALVLDAEGRMAGIVSFEDVLEEIVGDIRDEFDIERGPVFEHTELAIVVSGTFTMRELRAETGWNFEWQPRESVAAWVERHRGRPLKRGETFTIGEYRLTAVEVSAERLRRVRVERPAPSESPT